MILYDRLIIAIVEGLEKGNGTAAPDISTLSLYSWAIGLGHMPLTSSLSSQSPSR